MWLYIRSYYSDKTKIAELPDEIITFLQGIFQSVDTKTIQVAMMGSNGGLGYLQIQLHDQNTLKTGEVYVKTAVNYHNYGCLDIFI